MRGLSCLFLIATVVCGIAACTSRSANNGAEPATSWSFDDTPVALAPYRDRAKQGFDAVGKRLIPRLTAALASGGAAEAVRVCKDVAQPMTHEARGQVGFPVGRTSHKLRNPANSAPSWLKALVYGSAGKKGSDVQPLVFDLGDRVGVASPIIAAEMCLQCHGSDDQINAEVQQILAAEYPQDAARGFAAGDVRGWFWAELPKK